MGKSYGCTSLFVTKINILSLQTKKIKMSKTLTPPDQLYPILLTAKTLFFSGYIKAMNLIFIWVILMNVFHYSLLKLISWVYKQTKNKNE